MSEQSPPATRRRVKEIDVDRRRELRLLWQGAIAIAVAVLFVLVRELLYR